MRSAYKGGFMNEEMKRLIEAMNAAGYEVIGIEDDGDHDGWDEEKKEAYYADSGIYRIKVGKKRKTPVRASSLSELAAMTAQNDEKAAVSVGGAKFIFDENKRV